MTEQQQKALLDWKARQNAGEHMPCPRCGRDTMREQLYHNASSRHADLYVCEACGAAEAMLDAFSKPLPMEAWACMKELLDCKAMTGAQLWEFLQSGQAQFLCRLYERWQEESQYEDFRDYQQTAHHNCPGLFRLEQEPFQAVYECADGQVIVRFESTREGTLMIADWMARQE